VPAFNLYAINDDGDELPVIDVTNVQRLLLRLLHGKSMLGRGLVAASGTFVDGMTTYLLKLGPGGDPRRSD
jgi:hypothetical protein